MIKSILHVLPNTGEETVGTCIVKSQCTSKKVDIVELEIIEHCLERPRTLENLSIMIVDRVPTMPSMWGALVGQVRRRWEVVWMQRIDAQLNNLVFAVLFNLRIPS